MRNSITIILLSVLFVAPAYTQTMSLKSIEDDDSGIMVEYNWKKLEEWLGGKDMSSHTFRFSIDHALTDDIKFSILPSLSLISDKLGSSSTKLSPGCYIGYTGIHSIGRTSFGGFYRGGIGVTYEGNDFDAGALDTDFRESINTGFQVGVGVFGDADLPLMEIRGFFGIFLRNIWKNQIIDLAKSYSPDLKLLGEVGVDVKISENQSFFLMLSSPSNEWDPSYHVGFKLY